MPRKAGPPKLRLREETDTWTIHWREGGRPREESTGFRSGDRAAAEGYFADWLKGRGRAGGPRDPADVTCGECLRTYAEHRGPKVSDPKRIAYALQALLPFWRHVPVAHVTPPVTERYLRERLAQIAKRRSDHAEAVRKRGGLPRQPRPASEGTVRKELAVLNAAVNWCVKAGMMPYGRTAELPERPPPRDRWLTRAEAAKLMRSARRSKNGKHLADFIRLGLRTGQRKTTILSLRWTQNTQGGWVDLERGIIDFNPVGRRRTKKRRPVIRCAPGLLCWLRALHKNRRTDHVIERRFKRVVDGKRAPVGEPVADVKKAFERAVEHAGLGAGVTPHTLRHSAATLLMQRNVPTAKAAGYLGMSEAVFVSTYAKHHPDYQQEAVEAMS